MTDAQKLSLLYGVVIAGAVLFLMLVSGGTPPGGVWLFSAVCGIAGGATFALLAQKRKGGDR
ncbi:MAG: hypothetical protein AAFR17_04290 [Pseudomonadota bacterium]